MQVRFTVDKLIVNGYEAVSRKDERKQLATMMKKELGLV